MKPEVAHALWVGAVYMYHSVLSSIVVTGITTMVWLTLLMLCSLAYKGIGFKAFIRAGWDFNCSIGPLWTLYFAGRNALYPSPALVYFGIVVTLTTVIFIWQLVSSVRQLHPSSSWDAKDNAHLRS